MLSKDKTPNRKQDDALGNLAAALNELEAAQDRLEAAQRRVDAALLDAVEVRAGAWAQDMLGMKHATFWRYVKAARVATGRKGRLG